MLAWWLCRWNTHPGYIAAVGKRIKLGLEQYAPEDRDKVTIMFSAHSVPMTTVYKGDPYTTEIASTAEHVMKSLGIKNNYILSWQSKGAECVSMVLDVMNLIALTADDVLL